MIPNYKDRAPGLPQWAAGAMNATVILDQGGNVAFTNLDEVSGRVVVRCTKSADVSSIVVKLEGESRTRLMSPGGGPNNERPRPQLEYHKILYRMQMVFPPPDVLEGRGSKAAYTLPPGSHEYPFKFKIPFNNSCANERGQAPKISMSATAGFEMARPPSRHVKKTLPPTLSGFPGEAEIRYFVKATINRHSFFKENPRAYTPFNFFPIEPPRPDPAGSEVFARQKHQFTPPPDSEPVKGKMKSLFGMKKEPDPPMGRADAPFVSVDARLPEPAILTCNQEVPLRIIVKKLNDYHDPIYLQNLQVSLIGNTKIKAHEVHRTESNSWVLMSKSNMGMTIGDPSDAVGTETVIDERLWRGQPLPNTVAPSFETCNISREYQVDVRVGLSYNGSATKGHDKVRKGQIPRIVRMRMRLCSFLPLHLHRANWRPAAVDSLAIEARYFSILRHSSTTSVA